MLERDDRIITACRFLHRDTSRFREAPILWIMHWKVDAKWVPVLQFRLCFVYVCGTFFMGVIKKQRQTLGKIRQSEANPPCALSNCQQTDVVVGSDTMSNMNFGCCSWKKNTYLAKVLASVANDTDRYLGHFKNMDIKSRLHRWLVSASNETASSLNDDSPTSWKTYDGIKSSWSYLN